MQEKDTNRLVHITITRSRKGLLKWTPARVLINNRYSSFYPSEMKEFDTGAGNLTIVINRYKDLTFEAGEGESRSFVIKEGYTDTGFVLKYLVLLSALGWFLYTFIFSQPGNHDPSLSFFATLFTFWIGWQLRKEYFYLEEK